MDKIVKVTPLEDFKLEIITSSGISSLSYPKQEFRGIIDSFIL